MHNKKVKKYNLNSRLEGSISNKDIDLSLKHHEEYSNNVDILSLKGGISDHLKRNRV